MKKILFIICFLLCDKVYAINDITIEGEQLIPEFNKNIFIYNYYTNKDIVKIRIDESEKELQLNDDNNTFVFDDYTIHIYKNYVKSDTEEVYLTDLKIGGYEIYFDKNIFEYYIDIFDEEKLDIKYELSNDKGYVLVSGNGNFNKSDNIITINVNNKYEYKIHALKTINVSYIRENKEENYVIKKEIAKYLVITISCIISFVYYYMMFNKSYHI